MRLSLRFLLPLLFTTVAFSQNTVGLCELLRNPKAYNGKEVVVRATYQYGFEWSYLYCLDCLEKGKTWLQIDDDLDNASAKSLRRLPKGSGIVTLTVQGVFVTGSTYGHLNSYRYQLVAKKIGKMIVLQKGMKGISRETATVGKSGCGGQNPR